MFTALAFIVVMRRGGRLEKDLVVLKDVIDKRLRVRRKQDRRRRRRCYDLLIDRVNLSVRVVEANVRVKVADQVGLKSRRMNRGGLRDGRGIWPLVPQGQILTDESYGIVVSPSRSVMSPADRDSKQPSADRAGDRVNAVVGRKVGDNVGGRCQEIIEGGQCAGEAFPKAFGRRKPQHT